MELEILEYVNSLIENRDLDYKAISEAILSRIDEDADFKEKLLRIEDNLIKENNSVVNCLLELTLNTYASGLLSREYFLFNMKLVVEDRRGNNPQYKEE